MSTDIPDRREELDQYVEDRLGDHEDLLERIATSDAPLSDDAERLLEILDAGSDQS